MFQFYCNKCFKRRKYETALELFVSRCGHIFCGECVLEKCSICSRPFTPIAINREMPTSMAEYFSSPIKQYEHYKKIMKFHHEQERRLVEHMCRSTVEENKKADAEIEAYAKLNNSIKRQIEEEREKIRKLREYAAYYERRFEQASYMKPPITSQQRPRCPSRIQNIESAPLKSFTTPIRPNIIFPRSPTLSCGNKTNSTADTTNVAEAMPAKKAKNLPPLMPFTQYKLLNPQFSFELDK